MHHHYFNETSANPSLVLLTSPFMNKLNYVTRQVQDSCGQIINDLAKSGMIGSISGKIIFAGMEL